MTGPAAGQEGAGDLGRWRGVLRTGAAAAVGSVALIVVQVAVFALHPPPVEITEVLALLQRNPALGLLSLDVLYVVNNVLDRTAIDHAKKHGCLWNRDMEAIVEESGLEVVHLERSSFGTHYFFVLRPAEKHAL